MFNAIFFYSLAGILLTVSFRKDRQKTAKALQVARKFFLKLLPTALGILTCVGLMLSLFNPETISRLIGAESGILGVAMALVIGSLSMIPGFVAFQTAASLLDSGAGIVPVAAFIATLTGVGTLMLPIEASFFGKRFAVARNSIFFVAAVLFTILTGVFYA